MLEHSNSEITQFFYTEIRISLLRLISYFKLNYRVYTGYQKIWGTNLSVMIPISYTRFILFIYDFRY